MLLQLFWTFFKIGLFTFGGGYAMIATVREAVVQQKKWLMQPLKNTKKKQVYN